MVIVEPGERGDVDKVEICLIGVKSLHENLMLGRVLSRMKTAPIISDHLTNYF